MHAALMPPTVNILDLTGIQVAASRSGPETNVAAQKSASLLPKARFADV